MAKEILAVPEESLLEVIAVIMAGLESVKVSKDTEENLRKWCKEETRYLLGHAAGSNRHRGRAPITKPPSSERIS